MAIIPSLTPCSPTISPPVIAQDPPCLCPPSAATPPPPRPLWGHGVADHILIWPASPIWREALDGLRGDTGRRSEVKWPGLFTRRWEVQTADACLVFVLIPLMTPLKTIEYLYHYQSIKLIYIYYKNSLECLSVAFFFTWKFIEMQEKNSISSSNQ